jgi:hypothetical protein
LGDKKTVKRIMVGKLKTVDNVEDLENSMVWVRERTIPTERQPLVGEVIANFCG